MAGMTRKKVIWLMAVLMVALAAGWVAAATATSFTGKVASAITEVAGGKFEIVLGLAEYPGQAFYIELSDAPKFGLTSDVEIKSGAEFGKFTEALEKLKGTRVKLTVQPLPEFGNQAHRVKGLERLHGK